MSQRYPPEVHAFIRENVVGRTAAELAAMTNAAFGTNFTQATMHSYKTNHKLKSGTPIGIPKGSPSKQFPAPVADFIRSNYQGVGPKEMTAMVNQAFDRNYSTKQIAAYYKNHKFNSGLTGQFEKGTIPPNKGRKGYCAPGCEKTHFQKGHQPANKLPIGTIKTKTDGYVWKKIGEGSREWRQLHILVWEEANGPVPKGCNIIFRDGDRQNCELSNLAIVTKGENAVLNKLALRPQDPEYTDAAILIAKIRIAANKQKKRSNNHERKKKHLSHAEG